MRQRHRVVDISDRLPGTPIPVILLQGLPLSGQDAFWQHLESDFPAATLERVDGFPDLGDESNCNQCTLTNFLLEQVEEAAKKLRGLSPSVICLEIPVESDVTRITSAMKEVAGIFVQSVVTCVNLERFSWDYATDRSHLERFEALGEAPFNISQTALRQSVLESLVDQIECADFIYLSGSSDHERSIELIRLLQPRASLLDQRAFLSGVCFTIQPTFDVDLTYRSAGWQKRTQTQSAPYYFKAKRPFHPMRLNALIDRWPESIVRSYGTVWIASHSDFSVTISQIGPSGFFFSPEGYWIGTLSPQGRQQAMLEHPELKIDWDEKYFDRVTEIAFVSNEPLTEEWSRELESCLLTDFEMRLDWSRLQNPFPTFGENEEEVAPAETGDLERPRRLSLVRTSNP